MSSQLNEIADIPREFLREGTQFMNRCAKRTPGVDTVTDRDGGIG